MTDDVDPNAEAKPTDREWRRLRTHNAALQLVRDHAAEFLEVACVQQPLLPLDLAWLLRELSDAITEADEAEDGDGCDG